MPEGIRGYYILPYVYAFPDYVPMRVSGLGVPTMSQNTTSASTRDTVLEKAAPIMVTIGDRSFVANVKTFSTGSIGYNVNDKMPVVIDGRAYMVQVGLNLTLIGSKEW